MEAPPKDFPKIFAKLTDNPILIEFLLLISEHYNCITDFDAMASDIDFITTCEIPQSLLKDHQLTFLTRVGQ